MEEKKEAAIAAALNTTTDVIIPQSSTLLTFDRQGFENASKNAYALKQQPPCQSTFINFAPGLKVMANYRAIGKADAGTFWLYRHGCWERADRFWGLIEREVHKLLSDNNAQFAKIARLVLARELTKHSLFYSAFDPEPFKDRGVYPVFLSSGRVDFDSEGKATTHDCNPLIVNQFVVKTIPNQMPTPNYDDFMFKVTGGDFETQETLENMMALCLTPVGLHPYFFLLVGDGKNGKSTIQALLRRLIGHKHCSALSLDSINDTSIETLGASLANLSAESSANRMPEAILKQLASGESRTCNPKYRDPYDVTPMAKLIFALNKLPVALDASDGFWRRAVVIPFKIKITKPDPLFLRRILPELPGVCSMLLQKLSKIIAGGGEIFLSETVKTATRGYQQESSVMETFVCELKESRELLQNYLKTTGPYVGQYLLSGQEFYQVFDIYVRQNGYKPLGRKEFLSRLRDLLDRGEHNFLSEGKLNGKANFRIYA